MVELVECKADSDVVAFRVRKLGAEVQVEVQDDPHEANTLVTARLLPSQATRLAYALLAAAVASRAQQGVKVGDRYATKFDPFTVQSYASDTNWRVKYDDGLVIDTKEDSFADYCEEFNAKKEED